MMTKLEKLRATIVCGFAGIGKSTAAKEIAGVVDLESTPFEKDWERYAKVAMHLAKNGYTVLLSCHKEIREELHKCGVAYTLALPPKEAKQEYIERYTTRGNNEDFVKLLDCNWDNFLTVLPYETSVVIVDDFLTSVLCNPV